MTCKELNLYEHKEDLKEQTRERRIKEVLKGRMKPCDASIIKKLGVRYEKIQN